VPKPEDDQLHSICEAEKPLGSKLGGRNFRVEPVGETFAKRIHGPIVSMRLIGQSIEVVDRRTDRQNGLIPELPQNGDLPKSPPPSALVPIGGSNSEFDVASCFAADSTRNHVI
jgi:hypothetical protein